MRVPNCLIFVLSKFFFRRFSPLNFILEFLSNFHELLDVLTLSVDDYLGALFLLRDVLQLLTQLLDRLLLRRNLTFQEGFILLIVLLLLDLLSDNLLEFTEGLFEGDFLVPQLLDLAVLLLQMELCLLGLLKVNVFGLLHALAVLILEFLLHFYQVMICLLLSLLQLHLQLVLDCLHLELMLLLDFIELLFMLLFRLLIILTQAEVFVLDLLELLVDLLNLRGELLVFVLQIVHFLPDGLFDIIPPFLFHSRLFFVSQNDLLVVVVFTLIVFDFLSVLIVFNPCGLHLFCQYLVSSFFAPVELVQTLVGQLAGILFLYLLLAVFFPVDRLVNLLVQIAGFFFIVADESLSPLQIAQAEILETTLASCIEGAVTRSWGRFGSGWEAGDVFVIIRLDHQLRLPGSLVGRSPLS